MDQTAIKMIFVCIPSTCLLALTAAYPSFETELVDQWGEIGSFSNKQAKTAMIGYNQCLFPILPSRADDSCKALLQIMT